MRIFLEKVAPYFIAPVYWILYFTWRIQETGSSIVLQKHVKEGMPCLYAHWHGDELVLIGYYSFRKLAVLSSLSKDGSIMAKVLSLLGYQVFRGSSSRSGARGLIGLIRAVKNGSQAAIAVDGPKGPIYKVKPGIADLALRTNQPIVCLRAYAESSWKIPRAWNQSYIPKPFSKVKIVYANPIFPSQNGELNQLITQVEKTLLEITPV